MKLSEFVDKFIEHNSTVRLVYEEKGGNRLVLDNWDDVSMAWEIIKGEGKYKSYSDHNVIGITSIFVVKSDNTDAINIVIEEK